MNSGKTRKPSSLLAFINLFPNQWYQNWSNLDVISASTNSNCREAHPPPPSPLIKTHFLPDFYKRLNTCS